MKKVIYTLLCTCLMSTAYSQVTLTLQPDSTDGKDAYIFFLTDQTGPFGPTSDQNYGQSPDFIACEWTWNGSPGTIKSLIDFDISSIPVNAVIVDAKLSLYANLTSGNGAHSTLSGSNECTIRQITASWDENTVTWNTAPTVTNTNSLNLAASTVGDQDYLDMDVTAMIQEEHLNPSANHGFMIKIDTEDYYRSMIFASSDNLDANLHPKLVVEYMDFTGLPEDEKEKNIRIYPNPSNGKISINMDGEYRFRIKNLSGQIIAESLNTALGVQTVDLVNISAGLYVVELISEGNTYTRKVCVN